MQTTHSEDLLLEIQESTVQLNAEIDERRGITLVPYFSSLIPSYYLGGCV